MADIKSCGFLIFRNDPKPWFLLMRHPNRWDLPKGHVDKGENDLECALRELEEETGISVDQIRIDKHFRFVHDYKINSKRQQGKKKRKRLVVFLAELTESVELQLTEHESYEWFEWQPPHEIQSKTIDPLLEYLAEYWD